MTTPRRPERSEGSPAAANVATSGQRRIGAHIDKLRVAAAVAFFILLPAIASACPVCYGNPDSPMTKGTNNAILFLLGIVGLVQIGFIALFIAFWRRAREQRRRFRLIRTEELG